MTDYSLESDDFKALAKKEKDKRIYQRLMMLAYLKEGMSKAQVSRFDVVKLFSTTQLRGIL